MTEWTDEEPDADEAEAASFKNTTAWREREIVLERRAVALARNHEAHEIEMANRADRQARVEAEAILRQTIQDFTALRQALIAKGAPVGNAEMLAWVQNLPDKGA